MNRNALSRKTLHRAARFRWTAALLAISIGVIAGRTSAAERPNIVIVYTDDQGFGDASCYNPESKVQTPNMDALAATGLRFTDAHSADAVCTPSRYALLTGRYCWRTTLKKGVLGAEHPCLIKANQPTLATLCKRQNYVTWMVGKWHLGMDFPGDSHRNRDWSQPVRDMPLDKGFDRFFGIPASLNYGVLAWFDGRFAEVPPTQFTAKKPNSRHSDYRIQPPYQNTFAAATKKFKKQIIEVAPDFVDDQCLSRFTERAVSLISSHGTSPKSDQPFFLYLPLTSPHYPVCPRPEFHGKGEAGGYGEFLLETDYHLGRVVEALKKAGVYENTLLIFTSDNGPENSWKQRTKEFGHQSNAMLREGKRSIYEGGHRVPFLCSWPAGILQPGRVVEKPVCQSDIFATLNDILGEPEAVAPDSESFLASFTSSHTTARNSPMIHHSSSGQFAVRVGDWKLVMSKSTGQPELYNLRDDLGESKNVAKRHPEIVERLTATLTRSIVRGRTSVGPDQTNDTGHWSALHWISPSEYSVTTPQ